MERGGGGGDSGWRGVGEEGIVDGEGGGGGDSGWRGVGEEGIVDGEGWGRRG